MKKLGLLAVLVIVFIGFSSIFTIQQVDRGLVTRLGKLVEDQETGDAKVYQPGLHFKIPFVTNVVDLDTRLQTLDISGSRIVTNEKKDVIVSSFIKWRIDDFPTFYKATNNGNTAVAENLLRQKAEDGLRAEFGQRTIPEVVSGERIDIMAILQRELAASAGSLGVHVADVRIKQIDLPDEVKESVFERMRAERQQAAAQHRADGEREAEKLRATADASVTVLLAQAERQSRQMRGDGDATAAKIYADAYSQDPEFYAFYRSLSAYKDAFNDRDDMLVLSPNSDFFKYFQDAAALPNNRTN